MSLAINEPSLAELVNKSYK